MGRVKTAPQDAAPRRVDGSMSLLVDMMANTLDEAYAERAARKAGAGPEAPEPPTGRGPSLRRKATAVVTLLALGLVTGTAVAQVRARQDATTGLRTELAAQVRQRTAETEQLSQQAEGLRAEVAAGQAQALGADAAGRRAAQRLEDLGLASGTLPVVGPGVVARLSDATADQVEAEEPLRGGSITDGRVQDRDLQDVVNALWAAGAEAISINDVRLTALTAIRSAGDAVLVDFQLLSPPYDVRAIGDPATLELELLDGPAGRRLNTYVLRYGLGFEVRRDRSLSLPGASTPELRVALPPEDS
jgi:uncharacterized protein YlxW (UPF0749 family)